MGTKITPFNLHTSVDSHVKGRIDSDYVQARSGSGGTDSASTQAMIDSNFTNMNKVMSFPDGGNGIDSAKLTFGNDSDFKIYHDGSRTIMHDAGTGEVQIRASQLRIRNPGDTETLAKFVQDGAAELFHGMSGGSSEKKFETTTYGSTVTGTINADSATFGGGITVTGGNTGDVLLTFATDRSWQFQQSGDDAQTQLQLKANTDSKIFSIANNNGDNDFFFFTSHTGTPYLYIGEDAQIKFEGATANDYETILTVTDPTADRTITLPDNTGTVLVKDANDDVIITSTDAGAGDDPSLILYRNSSSPADNDDIGQIIFRGRNDNTQDVNYARFYVDTYDVSDGNENGQLVLKNMLYGTEETVFSTGYGHLYLSHNITMMSGKYLRFEGSTDDNNETVLTVTDPTADRTITIPDATGTMALTSDITVTASSTTTFTNKTLTSPAINAGTLSGAFTGTADLTGLVLSGASPLVFEGSTDNAHETSLAVQDPTADRTVTLPNITGRIDELLITEGSFNSTSLAFNSAVITNEYSEFRLVLSNCKPSTQTYVYMRVGSSNSADTGSNYGQALYYSGYYGSASAYSINHVNDGVSAFVIADGYAQLGTGTGQNGHFEITLLNPNTSSHYKLFKINSQVWSYYPMLMGRYIDAQVWKSTAAINYLQVYPGSGNLSCTYKLYGTRAY